MEMTYKDLIAKIMLFDKEQLEKIVTVFVPSVGQYYDAESLGFITGEEENDSFEEGDPIIATRMTPLN
jgi:hypothetical protein